MDRSWSLHPGIRLSLFLGFPARHRSGPNLDAWGAVAGNFSVEADLGFCECIPSVFCMLSETHRPWLDSVPCHLFHRRNMRDRIRIQRRRSFRTSCLRCPVCLHAVHKMDEISRDFTVRVDTSSESSDPVFLFDRV